MRTLDVAAEYLQSCRDRGLAMATVEKYRWELEVLAKSCPKLPKRGRHVLRALTRTEHGLETRRSCALVWAPSSAGAVGGMTGPTRCSNWRSCPDCAAVSPECSANSKSSSCWALVKVAGTW